MSKKSRRRSRYAKKQNPPRFAGIRAVTPLDNDAGLKKILGTDTGEKKTALRESVKAILLETGGFEAPPSKEEPEPEFFGEVAPKVEKKQNPSNLPALPPPAKTTPPRTSYPTKESVRQTLLAARSVSSRTAPQSSANSADSFESEKWQHKFADGVVPNTLVVAFIQLFEITAHNRHLRTFVIPELPGYTRVIIYDNKENFEKYETA